MRKIWNNKRKNSEEHLENELNEKENEFENQKREMELRYENEKEDKYSKIIFRAN